MQHVIELDSEDIKKIIAEHLKNDTRYEWNVKLLTSNGDDSVALVAARAERTGRAV